MPVEPDPIDRLEAELAATRRAAQQAAAAQQQTALYTAEIAARLRPPRTRWKLLLVLAIGIPVFVVLASKALSWWAEARREEEQQPLPSQRP